MNFLASFFILGGNVVQLADVYRCFCQEPELTGKTITLNETPNRGGHSFFLFFMVEMLGGCIPYPYVVVVTL